MVPLGLDRLYWFTKLALRPSARGRILPVGGGKIVVSIPKNAYGIQTGFFIAQLSRAGGLIPIEGPYRTRILAAVAAVT